MASPVTMAALLKRLGGRARLIGAGTQIVDDVEHDSRRVTPGALFACFVGDRADGHDHAPAAVASGAVALLTARELDLDVPQLIVDDPRSAVGPVAAAVHGDPSRSMLTIGVTGTNGKTTVTHLLGEILRRAGRSTAVIGTLSGARTTPEAPDLARQLAGLRDAGTEAVAMEVSSHALEARRVDGCQFDLAIFTNLSPDHLDFHESMESYFSAKARLFDPSLSTQAVVNLDDPHGRLLGDAATIPTVGFGLDDADDIVEMITGTRFLWAGMAIETALLGRFNVANAIAAALGASQLGIGADTIVNGLRGAAPVPGRFEPVDIGQDFAVIVDYSHTPDALEQAIAAARRLVASDKRVLVVFGCGGDRDRGKRPLMGRVAADGADRAIVTSDNPRNEDPMAIIEAILAGAVSGSVLEAEPDRRDAIRTAMVAAGPGDVVLIAGKGHETTQTIGERVSTFDDRVVATELLHELGHGGPAKVSA